MILCECIANVVRMYLNYFILECCSYGGESFVFQVAIQKFKDQDLQNYNFACCFVWVWNLVVDIAGGKEAEGVWEHGV